MVEGREDTKYFPCACGCEVVAVTKDEYGYIFAMYKYKPDDSWRGRLRAAWRCLRGNFTLDDIVLSADDAYGMGVYLHGGCYCLDNLPLGYRANWDNELKCFWVHNDSGGSCKYVEE